LDKKDEVPIGFQVMPPQDPNAPFVVIPVTRNQFWGILATFAGAYAGLIYVMISIVYGGINDRLIGSKSISRLLSLQMSRLRIY
jgi:hypothetical protein